MSDICPTCDQGPYKSIGRHWGQSCEAPPYTDRQRWILDAAILQGAKFYSANPETKNYELLIRSRVRSFLERISRSMGIHAGKLWGEARQDGEGNEYDVFFLRIKATERMTDLHDRWTDSINNLSLPPEFTLTPTVARFWYLLGGAPVIPSGADRSGVKLETPINVGDRTSIIRELNERHRARLYNDGVLVEDGNKFFQWTALDREDEQGEQSLSDEEEEEVSPDTVPPETAGTVETAHVTNPTESAVGQPVADNPLLPAEGSFSVSSVPQLNEVLTGMARRIDSFNEEEEATPEMVAELAESSQSNEIEEIHAEIDSLYRQLGLVKEKLEAEPDGTRQTFDLTGSETLVVEVQ